MICTAGKIEIKSKGDSLALGEGMSAFIPASEEVVSVRCSKGKSGEVYIAGANY